VGRRHRGPARAGRASAGGRPPRAGDGGWCGLEWCGGVGSGSGWVGVVPLDRSGQGGSNGTGYNVAVAVLTEIRSMKEHFEICKDFVCFFFGIVGGWGGLD
jgi:hypothetical protein